MIAISYRREDTGSLTGRLYDRLKADFGPDQVFIDLDSIPPGADFRSHIADSLRHCNTLLVVIGPGWLGPSASGLRRIDDPTDFVRFEVTQALSQGMQVIPLLIDRTDMPASEALPGDLKELAFRNALRLDSGIDFHHHVDRLCSRLREINSATPDAPVRLSGTTAFVGRSKAKENQAAPDLQHYRPPSRKSDAPPLRQGAKVGWLRSRLAYHGLIRLPSDPPPIETSALWLPLRKLDRLGRAYSRLAVTWLFMMSCLVMMSGGMLLILSVLTFMFPPPAGSPANAAISMFIPGVVIFPLSILFFRKILRQRRLMNANKSA
jgi:hypothetical protein